MKSLIKTYSINIFLSAYMCYDALVSASGILLLVWPVSGVDYGE